MKISQIRKRHTIMKVMSNIIGSVLIQWYRIKYRYYANPHKVIYIDLNKIHGCYAGDLKRELSFEGQIKGGDWKIISHKERLNTPKCRGLKERFIDNKPWGATALFTEWYAKYFKIGQTIKGMKNIEELEKYYEKYYDNLHQNIKAAGILPPDKNISPIYIMIGPNGEIITTYDGNHRLYMAMILNIRKIPVKILRRHKEWQNIREKLINIRTDNMDEYLEHPDIISDEIVSF